MPLPFQTYSENLREAVRLKSVRENHEVSMSTISRETSYSYEHIRKAMRGEAVFGEHANRVICEYLGLPVQEMWELAQREKIADKIGHLPVRVHDPIGEELANCWREMSKDQRRMLLQMAKGLVALDHQPQHAHA